MSPHKLIKKEARGRLAGHWPSALGVLLLPAAVLVLFFIVSEYILFCAGYFELDSIGQIVFRPALQWALAGIAVLFLLTMIFLLHPMLLGVRRWQAALAFGRDVGAGSCLYYFSRKEYRSCVKYTLRHGILILLGTVFSAAVVVLLTGIKLYFGHPEIYELLGKGLRHLSMLQLKVLTDLFLDTISTGIIILILLYIPLFAADYLFVTSPAPGIFRRSAQLVFTNIFRLLFLFGSFCGWIILSLFVFPLVYTLPYMGMAATVFCKWIVYNSKPSSASVLKN